MEIFQEFDIDSKGFLTRSDARRIMNMIGEEVDEKDLDEMMKMMDPEATGIILTTQFVNALLYPPPLFENPFIEPGCTANQLPVRKRAELQANAYDDVEQEMARASAERRLIFNEVNAEGRIKPAEIKRIFSRFQAIDRSNKGLIKYQDFLVVMQRPDSESSRRLFSLCDKEGSGEVDLKEFILGLTQFTDASPEDRVKFAFKLFDTDNSGYIDRKELTRVVKSSAPTSAIPQWINRRVDELYDSVGLKRDAQIDMATFLVVAKKNPLMIAPVLDDV